MRKSRFLQSILVLLVASIAGCAGAKHASQAQAGDAPGAPVSPEATAAPATWPRTFTKEGNTLVMYAPQVDNWVNHSKIQFRTAIALTPAGSGKTRYGVAAVRADTNIDDETRTVLLSNLDVALRFPGVDDSTASQLKALANECLPNLGTLDVSLDQIIAYTQSNVNAKQVDVNLNPPPIYYSDVPAILVVYMGSPQFKPVTGTKLMFAVNTNWVVLMDMSTSQYYLLDDDSWLTSTDPAKGPWTAATSLPAEFSRLPDSGNWQDVKKHIPGSGLKAMPRVLTSLEPAELIATDGAPDYTPLAGTRLMYVSNPTMPLFLNLIDSNYYYMVSGRWFRAPDVTGPWSAASSNLPAEFAKIPSDSPMGFVLASVPGTQEARDAVVLSTVPHMATIALSNTTVNVSYEGTPKFVPVQGTAMTYAVNTPYQVLFAEGQYYCCSQGVWFVAPTATGAWSVCTTVPSVIYTLPPTSPLYNVTYVQVYSATPTTVVVGYTGGYSGEYVATTGALMFGAGMLTGAILASDNCCWYGYNPCFYSYGCAAHYSYAYGCYYRSGGACYGPHGGAGWGSAYNPATGTWARGAAAYGPAGAHYGAQAYNPWTNTYSAHAGGTNGYKSWGRSYVQQGSSWAASGHQSTARGTTGWTENSSGQWAQGARSNALNSSAAKTSNGDLYASHDGNVYKKSDDQWQKYDGNGNWQNTTANKSTAQAREQSFSSSGAESNWQSSMQNRSQNNANNWKSQGSSDQWKSNWENRSSGGSDGGWGQHDTERGLSQDSFSRNWGSSNASSSWGSRFGGSGGGGFLSRFGGSGGGGWGGRFGGGGRRR